MNATNMTNITNITNASTSSICIEMNDFYIINGSLFITIILNILLTFVSCRYSKLLKLKSFNIYKMIANNLADSNNISKQGNVNISNPIDQKIISIIDPSNIID